MTITEDASIAIEKVRDYLLKPLVVDDKSRYLSLAGYSRADYWELLRDIRSQLLPGEATFQYRNKFGDFFELLGVLKGPNHKQISVKTIWVKDRKDVLRFVTLFPAKKEDYDEI